MHSVNLIAGKACYLAKLSYGSQLRQGNSNLSTLLMPEQLMLSESMSSGIMVTLILRVHTRAIKATNTHLHSIILLVTIAKNQTI